MVSDYVDDLLRDERESFKREEAAAKKFDNLSTRARRRCVRRRDNSRRHSPE
ncbi:gas vesicle protein [Bifidobacterium moukalabense DSM 27321]|uniref:Gas vesicle protein n=1 Tax=Bifidobacterium moukalabense DSM 27321 TaxID=1435051 RepID=W4N8K8_9BIFI|nr:gas vesicle protein [Bifidobacterium moukalabense DSM 27321]